MHRIYMEVNPNRKQTTTGVRRAPAGELQAAMFETTRNMFVKMTLCKYSETSKSGVGN